MILTVKNIFLIILISVFLTSCFGGGEETGGGSTADNDSSGSGGSTTIDSFYFSNAVASVNKLTSCSSSNQGQIYYISSTEEFRGCNGTEWVTVLKSELKNNGVSDEYLSNLRVPIGLALGRNNPEEISISIAAELLEEGGQ